MVGYAATARIRTEDHRSPEASITTVPIGGKRPASTRPAYRGTEDMDKPPGAGAFVGDVHAAILMAIGCIGYVTNGAVRELPRVHEMGFHMFAGNVAVSHAYAHIFDFGSVVKVGGWRFARATCCTQISTVC